MRRLGLLGGMSWESSVEYERVINETVREELGGVASADLLVRSFNFAEVESLQANARWEDAGRLLADAARELERAGAEGIVLCTNTMHLLADRITEAIKVPFLHIADSTGAAIEATGVRRVVLLGTRYTMEKEFLSGRLRDEFGLIVDIPNDDDRTTIHDIIYDELVRGIINPESRLRVLEIIGRATEAGAEGVIAGCTEIELLVTPEDMSVEFFPTALLHARAAARYALDG